MNANGADANGTFIIRGEVRPDLTFSAMKMYPDHCVFLWGNTSIEESKLVMSDWNNPVPLEEIDAFQGNWGFEEEGRSEGTFSIQLQ